MSMSAKTAETINGLLATNFPDVTTRVQSDGKRHRVLVTAKRVEMSSFKLVELAEITRGHKIVFGRTAGNFRMIVQ
jgi:hypothetical protein